jgi:hypothetical protein
MNWKIICMIMNFVGVLEAHDLVKFAWITASIWEPWLQSGCSYARISDQRHPIMNGILLHKFAFDTHCWQLLAAQLDNSPNLGTYFIDGRGRYNLQKEIWKICGHIAGIPTQLVCMELEFQWWIEMSILWSSKKQGKAITFFEFCTVRGITISWWAYASTRWCLGFRICGLIK